MLLSNSQFSWLDESALTLVKAFSVFIILKKAPKLLFGAWDRYNDFIEIRLNETRLQAHKDEEDVEKNDNVHAFNHVFIETYLENEKQVKNDL